MSSHICSFNLDPLNTLNCCEWTVVSCELVNTSLPPTSDTAWWCSQRGCYGALVTWPGPEQRASALSHEVIALDIQCNPYLGGESYSSELLSTYYRATSLGPLQPRLIYQEHESESNLLIKVSSWPLCTLIYTDIR